MDELRFVSLAPISAHSRERRCEAMTLRGRPREGATGYTHLWTQGISCEVRRCAPHGSLPHKGGGNVVASLRPSPRNAPAFGAEMCACLGAFAETTVAWFEPKIHQSTIRPWSPSFLHCRWCCARSA